ncbi:MAG TPA: hypothetical protein VF929_05285 [Gemmatimonadaceae bacterium]
MNAPDVLEPPALATSAGAEALRVGAINGFVLAFTGDSRGQVTTSGALADEFFNAATAAIAIAEADQRIVPDPGSAYPYAQVQRARLDAKRAIQAMQAYAPASRSKLGELFALKGYSELFLAENMCSGIPLGEIVDGTPVYGQPIASSELYTQAAIDFDSAAVYAADSVRILSLARVGRGRTLLGAGRVAEAAAAVAAVPTTFSYVTLQSAAVQPNGVYSIINSLRYITVSDREGGVGLDFRTAQDPRVPTVPVGRGVDGTTDVYGFASYSSLASPIVLAGGIEARLIEAEAALRAGDASGSLAMLNALRATKPGLAPLILEPTTSGRIDQLFRERAFWMFATGHRHGDMRRLVRQYGRAMETVFPSGPYKGGQMYGTEVTFTPDAQQLANPSYTGCASRAP